MSGSCKLFKESLSPEIVAELNEKGVALVPVPQSLIEDHLNIKACQQYALAEFRDNMVLLDTGHAKLMSPYFDIHRLQQIPGLEKARYEDPYSGGQGNSMRFLPWHLATIPSLSKASTICSVPVKRLGCWSVTPRPS